MGEIIDIRPGLWVWQIDHPDWRDGQGWDPRVASTWVQAGGHTIVIDPIAPAPADSEIWARLDASPPDTVIVLKPDHVRDVDLFVRRYGARAFGPGVFYRGDVPRSDIEEIWPGVDLPGGLVTLYDGRNRVETPVWVPAHRALVFADALTAPAGELRIWDTPWHRSRVVPALTTLLELPFEHVIVAHGTPVHDRAAFERALGAPPHTE